MQVALEIGIAGNAGERYRQLTAVVVLLIWIEAVLQFPAVRHTIIVAVLWRGKVVADEKRVIGTRLVNRAGVKGVADDVFEQAAVHTVARKSTRLGCKGSAQTGRRCVADGRVGVTAAQAVGLPQCRVGAIQVEVVAAVKKIVVGPARVSRHAVAADIKIVGTVAQEIVVKKGAPVSRAANSCIAYEVGINIKGRSRIVVHLYLLIPEEIVRYLHPQGFAGAVAALTGDFGHAPTYAVP